MNNNLKRYPVIKNDLLQAWDSADELILEEISFLDLSGKRILIVNDSFGALSSTLKEFDLTSYTDSYVSAQGQFLNGGIKCVNDLNALSGNYDFILLRIPKNMSFFEDILCRLTQHMTPESKLICGAMVKHLAKASFDLLNKYIGDTTTSLAKKKARLIFAHFQREKVKSSWPMSIKLDGFEKEFVHGSNLFSRDKLDIGTRFFLEHIPHGNFETILDLGCANGIVGITAKKLNPKAQILFSDEGAQAIQSAETNFKNHCEAQGEFFWINCFEGQKTNFLDLVLCNPPFHQGHTVGDFIAWQMFTDAHRSLKTGGKIRVIGNSHLGYQHKLKKIFGNSKIVATNQKFIIIDALKQRAMFTLKI